MCFTLNLFPPSIREEEAKLTTIEDMIDKKTLITTRCFLSPEKILAKRDGHKKTEKAVERRESIWCIGEDSIFVEKDFRIVLVRDTDNPKSDPKRKVSIPNCELSI